MPQTLFFHSILYLSALLDCVCGVCAPLFMILWIHLCLFRYGVSLNLLIVTGLGLIVDAYTSVFLGITSFFLIFSLWSFQKIKIGAAKIESFWYVWFSFNLSVWSFLLLRFLVFGRHGLDFTLYDVTYSFQYALPLLLSSSYPLIFYLLPSLKHSNAAFRHP